MGLSVSHVWCAAIRYDGVTRARASEATRPLPIDFALLTGRCAQPARRIMGYLYRVPPRHDDGETTWCDGLRRDVVGQILLGSVLDTFFPSSYELKIFG